MASSSSRTAATTSRVLALGSDQMPMKTAVSPEKATCSS